VALILDTNALSAAADGEPAAVDILNRSERLAVPVIVIGEYRFGILHSRQKHAYERWLTDWLAAVEVLPIEQTTAQHYAEIALELKKIGKPIPTNDLWIAALCRQHSLPLMSRDRHFDAVPGIDRINW
jgi:tRNA(fMet)-specific endonuclease VapC